MDGIEIPEDMPEDFNEAAEETLTQEGQAYNNVLQRAVNGTEGMGLSGAFHRQLLDKAMQEGGIPELISEVIRLAQAEANAEARYQAASQQLDELNEKLILEDRLSSESTEDRDWAEEEPEKNEPRANQGLSFLPPNNMSVRPGPDYMGKAFEALSHLMMQGSTEEIKFNAATALLHYEVAMRDQS